MSADSQWVSQDRRHRTAAGHVLAAHSEHTAAREADRTTYAGPGYSSGERITTRRAVILTLAG